MSWRDHTLGTSKPYRARKKKGTPEALHTNRIPSLHLQNCDHCPRLIQLAGIQRLLCREVGRQFVPAITSKRIEQDQSPPQGIKWQGGGGGGRRSNITCP